MMHNVFISLGSNIGDRFSYLKSAIELLGNSPNVRIKKISSIYETEPVGYTDQDSFLNAVVEIATDLSPHQLLDFTQDIEKKLQRERTIRWGPRTIDLDILMYNQENIKTERLIIPHPRMFDRAFVLIPLTEIYPEMKSEQLFQIEELLQREGIKKWKRDFGEEE